MFLKSYLIIIFLLIYNLAVAKDKIFIVSKVENEIITNFDIVREAEYLKILNPKLVQINQDQIEKIAKESLINEIIKKNEIERILDLNQENSYVDDYFKTLYTRLNFKDEKSFESFLSSSSNYSINKVKQKIKIEVLWNELIYLKYNDQLNINKEKLLEKIEKMDEKIRIEYKLSEIVFKKDKEMTLEELINKIKKSINNIGFNNTANIFSISDSSKLGGDIGWIDQNNLSKSIFDKLKNLEENEVTDPIQIGNDYLILKVNKIRQKNISIDKDEELIKMIKFETNKQLNQFSKIFFDKAKINYNINEK